ncbi:signal peptidase II [Cohnella hongkongensis]|uniref:Lipoprotein signal peptidase n=1 Tax=Cohnella hongkongensis TaxID=178337 RepID=A0ABV9FA45_9BACL
MSFYLIAIVVAAADQLTKVWVRMHLEVGETLILWGREWTRYENSGMAGGLLQGYGRLFGALAVLFVAGVLLYRKKEPRGLPVDCALGFLVGGAVGNGIDRLLFGQVTDFIVRSGGGILNVADHAIELGVVLMALTLLVQWARRKWSARQ